jgi:hypothetical protein
LVITTFNVEKRKAMEKKNTEVKPPPAKRARTTVSVKSRGKGKEKEQNTDKEEEQETYHFIGYVPAYGKVWELDGLKSGPLEVGELPEDSTSSKDPNRGWMDVVRPALRMKMEKYGGSGNDGSNIRFSLLAIVDDLYQKASDELELLKREKIALERRMEAGWETSVSSIHREFQDVRLNSSLTRSIPLFMNLRNQHLSNFIKRLMRRTLGRGEWTEISRFYKWPRRIWSPLGRRVFKTGCEQR